MDDEFAAEQRALAAVSWQLVAVREQLELPNSWIRRTVFGTDVFIQSFGGELRGFHNVCAHRGFPLRTSVCGAGPVQCSLHGWVYNKDGVPTGVPRNAELFQLSRDAQRELALPALRVDTIGRFVFATTSAAAPDLVAFLGAHADVYRALDASIGPLAGTCTLPSTANWKRHAEITLDDYHLASIHPTTFGAGEAPPTYKFVYRRDGLHSSMMRRRDPDWSFDGFWADVAGGTFDRTGYKIFNTFPVSYIGATIDVCTASVIIPLGPRRTEVVFYIFLWPGAPAELGPQLVRFNRELFGEDLAACQTWETAVDALGHPPVLGRLEERVGWFRDAYQEVMARGLR